MLRDSGLLFRTTLYNYEFIPHTARINSWDNLPIHTEAYIPAVACLAAVQKQQPVSVQHPWSDTTRSDEIISTIV